MTHTPTQIAAALVSCLAESATSPEIKYRAAEHLRRIEPQHSLCPQVASAAVPALAGMLAHGQSLPVMKEAALTLVLLAKADSRRELIAKGAMPRLVSLLQYSAYSGLRALAARVVLKLTGSAELMPAIADAALPALCALLGNTTNADGRSHAAT